MAMKPLTVEDKLGLDYFKVDDGHPHLKVDKALCEACETKICVYVCPVDDFASSDGRELILSWEGCVECGTCRVACNNAGNRGLAWENPRGGFGIHYRGGD